MRLDPSLRLGTCAERREAVTLIYSPDHRLLFLKTRKTAGTSIEIALSARVGAHAILTPVGDDEAARVAFAGRGAQNYDRRLRLREWRLRSLKQAIRTRRAPRVREFWNHITAAEVRQRLPDWDDLVRIAVVRNPWEVVASHYAMEQRRAGVRTVDEFIERFGVTSNWPIYTIDDQIAVHPIRYEQLHAELPPLLASVGIALPALPRAKDGRGRPSRRSVLEPRHVDLIAQVCAKEIDAFGYDF